MINGVTVREAWIDYLKSLTTVTALLSNGATEIREEEWKGADFSYPNIRVSRPLIQVEDCPPDSVSFIIHAYSEQKSSKQVDTIINTVAQQINNKAFTRLGVRFHAISIVTINRTEPEGELIWTGSLEVKMLVS